MAQFVHQLLGVPNRGFAFEAVFWFLVAALGAVVLYREWRSGRTFGNGALAWLAGAAFAGFGLWRWCGVVLFRHLYFGEAGLHVPTYGVAMAVGFSVAIFFGYRDFERTPGPLDGDKAIDVGFWLVVSGLVGARLLFMLTEIPHYVQLCREPLPGATPDCLAVLRFWEGGLVFYGGMIGQIVGSAIWCRRNAVPFFHLADAVSPWAALGHFFGRLGCIAGGCCFGAVREHGPGLVYPEGSPPWTAQLMAHDGAVREALITGGTSLPTWPVPAAEALVELGVCLLLALWTKRRKRFEGQLFLTWVAIYAAARFVLEIYRGDIVRGFVFEWVATGANRLLGLPAETVTMLSTSQAVAVAALVGALITRIVLARRAA